MKNIPWIFEMILSGMACSACRSCHIPSSDVAFPFHRRFLLILWLLRYFFGYQEMYIYVGIILFIIFLRNLSSFMWTRRLLLSPSFWNNEVIRSKYNESQTAFSFLILHQSCKENDCSHIDRLFSFFYIFHANEWENTTISRFIYFICL